MTEKAPSTSPEQPSSASVLADFENRRTELAAQADALENTPGFKMNAEQLVRHTQEKKLASEALAAFNDEYAGLGGNAIDDAQQAVDSLDFRSSAEDRIKATTALRDAKDAFHAQYLEAQAETTVAENNENPVESPVESDDEIGLIARAMAGEFSQSQPDTTENITETSQSDDDEPTAKHETDTDEAIKAHVAVLKTALDNASPAERKPIADKGPDVNQVRPDIDRDSELYDDDNESAEQLSRYELKERAKNIKRIRKEQKKQARKEAIAKAAEEKRGKEIMDYVKEQQEGRVKKSRIGSILRRLKSIHGTADAIPDNVVSLDEYRKTKTTEVNTSSKYDAAMQRVVEGINKNNGNVTSDEVEKAKDLRRQKLEEAEKNEKEAA